MLHVTPCDIGALRLRSGQAFGAEIHIRITRSNPRAGDHGYAGTVSTGQAARATT